MAKIKYKFMNTFGEQYVSVITRSIRGSQYNASGKRNSGNLLLMGLLMREDDEFIYLSDDGTEITDMIRKTDIIRMYIDNPIELMQNLGDIPPKAGMN